MKNFINNIKVINKDNNLFKIYIAIFSLLHLVYWCLEIYINKLRGVFLLDQQNNKIYFEKIMKLSKITTNLELLIIYSNILLLIVFIYKYRRGNNGVLRKYIITNIICIIFVLIISWILSVVFNAPYGNLYQPIISIFMYTFIVLIYYTITIGYRFIISKARRHENQ